MSTGKRTLSPYLVISAGTMGGDLTQATYTDIQNMDNVSVQLVWTGTPTGTFYVDGSLDKATWTALSLSPSAAAAGAASSILIDLNQLSFPYIRVRYVRTSGTGTLNAYISGKML